MLKDIEDPDGVTKAFETRINALSTNVGRILKAADECSVDMPEGFVMLSTVFNAALEKKKAEAKAKAEQSAPPA